MSFTYISTVRSCMIFDNYGKLKFLHFSFILLYFCSLLSTLFTTALWFHPYFLDCLFDPVIWPAPFYLLCDWLKFINCCCHLKTGNPPPPPPHGNSRHRDGAVQLWKDRSLSSLPFDRFIPYQSKLNRMVVISVKGLRSYKSWTNQLESESQHYKPWIEAKQYWNNGQTDCVLIS